ncbi:relA-associated inhibitor isoform X2 [Sardina pilchardus]|uniref:relA-associated inhibitor isoform X2 n=2 Tax=Sardina pilchardus TaxID=27697 RepID=UPI002E12C65F
MPGVRTRGPLSLSTAMASQASYGSSMLFQSMNEELNASLATADELSREFDSLLKEVSPNTNTPQQLPSEPSMRINVISSSPTPPSFEQEGSGGSSSSTASSLAYAPNISTYRPGPGSGDSISSNRLTPTDLAPARRSQLSPNQSPSTRRRGRSPSPSNYAYGQLSSPNQSPRTHRRNNSRGTLSYSPVSNPGTPTFDPSSGMIRLSTPTMDPFHSGRQSPRRSASPQPFIQSAANTLPRNFMPFKQTEESHRPKLHTNWNESDLDVSYEKKPHHTYDKTEWLRPSLPNRNWAESNLDGPPPASRKVPSHHGSLPRNTHISVSPDQPIISRISIPPTAPKARQHQPIPLSVIMRLQNPHATAVTHYPRYPGPEMDPAFFVQHFPTRDFQPQYSTLERQQRNYYGEELRPFEVDSEVEGLDPAMGASHFMQEGPVHFTGQGPETAGMSEQKPKVVPPPRPLSPTRLQPVLAPQSQPVPNLEEVLRIRSEIPRALKRRGSVEQSQPLRKSLVIQPNQYKQMINKLFHRKGLRVKGETGSDYSSSSDGEEGSPSPTASTSPLTNITGTNEHKGLNSILRRRSQKSSGRHARLSPLVLLLDGALVGELDTVQRAVQEMSNPSQSNDEGITALHNAICGGHYSVVDFLVRIGANVSAPDSHGWTPLHCAASCNDKTLCEYLVRSGAAVMAVTESDWATAAQKCDPYAPGYEECENFLRGVEDAMGVENSGVLYALWGYSSQAPDELSFREGDMVTILQKPEGVDWWWASLCGREGFVPNNYFGLFPKVRPKSLC